MQYLSRYIRFMLIPAIILSVISMIVIVPTSISFFLVILVVIYYALSIQKIDESTLKVVFIINVLSYLVLTLSLIISQGSASHPIWNSLYIINFHYCFIFLATLFSGEFFNGIILIMVLNTIELIFCYCVVKPQVNIKKIILILSCILLSIGIDFYTYNNSPSQKYKGHDFEYMNGYSSTDLSPFYPYTENNQLIQLNEPSSLIIEKEEDMPILDGAEACYPVYAAIANAVYKDIDQIEKKYALQEDENGKIVTFYNTSVGYSRLFNGEADMFFGAKPSQEQLEEASELGVELEYTPIGKEAFVFFVNKNNSIDNLKSNDIRKIYHGDITNWKELGGDNHDIIAFQRPERSGSQAMMKYFMQDVTLKEPLTYEMQSAMEGIIQEVAQYYNEDGAIGYTFKYFLEGLNQEDNVKILSIDGVYPTAQNIKNQSYPISTYLYCVTLKSNQKENVKKLKEYLLSPQGQYIIEQTGYCSLQ